jgi:hypothetical protein
MALRFASQRWLRPPPEQGVARLSRAGRSHQRNPLPTAALRQPRCEQGSRGRRPWCSTGCSSKLERSWRTLAQRGGDLREAVFTSPWRAALIMPGSRVRVPPLLSFEASCSHGVAGLSSSSISGAGRSLAPRLATSPAHFASSRAAALEPRRHRATQLA